MNSSERKLRSFSDCVYSTTAFEFMPNIITWLMPEIIDTNWCANVSFSIDSQSIWQDVSVAFYPVGMRVRFLVRRSQTSISGVFIPIINWKCLINSLEVTHDFSWNSFTHLTCCRCRSLDCCIVPSSYIPSICLHNECNSHTEQLKWWRSQRKTHALLNDVDKRINKSGVRACKREE